MSHTYPLARTARDALKAETAAARTRYEAEDLAGEREVKSLETEWLTPSPEELPDMLAKIEASPAHGFVQHYEDGEGNAVLAVTYWKLARSKVAKRKIAPRPKPGEPTEKSGAPDYTDDLYFRHGRNRKRRRKTVPNPNQFDLFDPDAAKVDPGQD
ncbi:MAG: hypothetical protein QNI84_02935 [Henriciella sp.]|nr:hypothetical protein [Henriciella sp.]